MKIGKWLLKFTVAFTLIASVAFAVVKLDAGSFIEDGHRAGGSLIESNVAVFLADGVDVSTLPPSFALVNKPVAIGALPASWKVVPQIKSTAGKYSARIETGQGVSLYGTGEIPGPLLRNGKITETWNADKPAYGKRNGNIYQSHPWVLAVRADGSAFGVLADTTYRCKIDLSKGIEFSTDGRPFPLYVIEGASPQKVVSKLADLTGHISMPPLWSLGYQQCRYSYYPDSRVREIADEFRSRKLPCDVIWLDIHYMDEYRIFTFDHSRFPDPKALNDYLHGRGFKSVWMIDPGVKKEAGYFVYDQGVAGNHFVLNKKGGEFIGRVWPGKCAFPDFTRPETRAWWGGLYKDFMANGIDGVWNDMNEPSVFDSLARTMPTSNLHRGGGDMPADTHELYHNVYGMLMARSTREGILAANPDKRPFVLTRSNFIGGQRYAATWTGDNMATWNHLEYSVNMILNMGMSGQPFAGPDIGGFMRPGSPEMFGRWFALGMFFPFSRGHANKGNIDKEPWVFGTEVENAARTALQRRYRLLPYFYTLFRESAVDGLPVMRPLFFADPADPKLRNENQAFMVGADLMVVAQLDPEANHKHNLPKGVWRQVSLVGENLSGDKYQPELRIRSGAIIPMGKIIQNTTEKSLDPLTLLISLDENGTAKGTLYEDAGEGWEFQNGQYLLTTYSAKTENGKVIVTISETEGKMNRPERKLIIELVGDNGVVKAEGSEKEPVIVVP